MSHPDTMRRHFSTLALLLALAGTGLLWGEMRVHALQPGDAAAEEAEGYLSLQINGRKQRLSLSRLSAEDLALAQTLSERLEDYQQESNFSSPWPTSTDMEDKVQARAVVEDEPTGTYIYETTHFRFFSPARLDLSTVSEMGRVFEGTCTACRAIPLNFPCRRFDTQRPVDAESGAAEEKLVARLFLTQEDYAREVGGSYGRSSGIFREPEILVPFESLGLVKKGKGYTMKSGGKLDAGTLIHELTHQMTLIGADYDVPIWFAEGMAEYVRLADYSLGNFDFSGVHNNIITYFVGGPGTTSRQLGRHVGSPPLEHMLNLSVRDFQAARGDETQFLYGFSALLAYYFIHLDGEGDGAHLKHWMRHLQGTQRASSRLSMKIPADASPAEIEAAQNYLQQQALRLKEDYHYAHLLNGRSWQELQEEFCRKVKKELGILITFADSPHKP